MEGVWRLVWSPSHGPLNNPVYCQHSETLGWGHVPGATATHVAEDFSVDVKINGLGLRDRDRKTERTPGTFRILTIGDSLTFGFGVQAEETFSSRLEDLLPRTEVLNGGVCGYGTDQALLYLEACGFGLNPDLIVVTLCGNDVEENLRGEMYGRAKPFFSQRDGELVVYNRPVPNPFLCRVSHLYRSLNKHFWTWRRTELTESEQIAGRDLLRRLLAKIGDQARVRGIDVVVCQTIAGFPISDRTDGYHALDLSGRLLERDDLVFAKDPHWNAKGHAFVATALREFLVARGLVTVRSGSRIQAGLRVPATSPLRR